MLPWLELRDLCRAIAARFPVVDPAPMSLCVPRIPSTSLTSRIAIPAVWP